MLAFDAGAAERYAQVLASRGAAGALISTADAQIAAICVVAETLAITAATLAAIWDVAGRSIHGVISLGTGSKR